MCFTEYFSFHLCPPYINNWLHLILQNKIHFFAKLHHSNPNHNTHYNPNSNVGTPSILSCLFWDILQHLVGFKTNSKHLSSKICPFFIRTSNYLVLLSWSTDGQIILTIDINLYQHTARFYQHFDNKLPAQIQYLIN